MGLRENSALISMSTIAQDNMAHFKPFELVNMVEQKSQRNFRTLKTLHVDV
jgi:hypothetical protein